MNEILKKILFASSFRFLYDRGTVKMFSWVVEVLTNPLKN